MSSWNALEISHDPVAMLREVSRVLKLGGIVHFDVHTFSTADLVKWHTWT